MSMAPAQGRHENLWDITYVQKQKQQRFAQPEILVPAPLKKEFIDALLFKEIVWDLCQVFPLMFSQLLRVEC